MDQQYTIFNDSNDKITNIQRLRHDSNKRMEKNKKIYIYKFKKLNKSKKERNIRL